MRRTYLKAWGAEVTDWVQAIIEETRSLIEKKGLEAPPITEDSVFLGGGLPIDSLDLATLIVSLEDKTGKDPFREGFREFRTVGQLAALYTQ